MYRAWKTPEYRPCPAHSPSRGARRSRATSAAGQRSSRATRLPTERSSPRSRRPASIAGHRARRAGRCARTCSFYATCAEAEAAGYRACKRCKPNAPAADAEQAGKIARACRLIETAEAAPSLDDARRTRWPQPLSLPPRVQGRDRRDAEGLRRRTPAQARARGAERRQVRDRSHLRSRFQFERPLLCRTLRRRSA